jgi:hypothetical protein
MLAPVSTRAGEYRFVRGDLIGNPAADPDLWGFCGLRTPTSHRLRHSATAGDDAGDLTHRPHVPNDALMFVKGIR